MKYQTDNGEKGEPRKRKIDKRKQGQAKMKSKNWNLKLKKNVWQACTERKNKDKDK